MVGILAEIVFWALMLPSMALSQTVQRTVFVHLFEWKWTTDVAKECEEWLGPKGFAAVQISPAQEHPVITHPGYPWWQRYQPVSYTLESRSGSRQELANMISRCNQAGVKVYADAVINHMAGTGTPPGQGTAGTSFDPQQRQYPVFHTVQTISTTSAISTTAMLDSKLLD